MSVISSPNSVFGSSNLIFQVNRVEVTARPGTPGWVGHGADSDRFRAATLSVFGGLPKLDSVPVPANPRPSWWLESAHHVVPYQRPGQYDELLTWCQTAAPGGPAVRLVCAPGGVGKTRLALELAAELHEDGWVSGVVTGDEYLGELTSQIRAVVDAGLRVFAAVDYAETRIRALRDLLERIPGTHLERVRIVLLARSGGTWWETLPYSSAAMRVLDPSPVDLKPFSRRAATEMFHTAYQRFREEIPTGAAAEAGPRFEPTSDMRALDIQAAALATVLSGPFDPTPPPEPLPAVLLHELRYWHRALQQRDVRLEMDDLLLSRLLVVPTLVRARDVESAEAAVAGCLEGAGLPVSVERLTELLAGLYPSESPGFHWGSLLPDRLAEALVAYVIDRSPSRERSCAQMIALLPGVAVHDAAHVLTVLSRTGGFDDRTATATRTREGVEFVIRGLLARRPDAFLPAAVLVAESIGRPSPVTEAARQAVTRADRAVVQQMVKSLPPFHSALIDLAREVQQTWVGMVRSGLAGGPSMENRGALVEALAALSTRIAAAGDFVTALAYAEEAQEVGSEGAGLESESVLAAYAGALNAAAFAHSGLGQTGRAVKDAEGAADIYRRLNEHDPVIWLPYLATSLHNLGVQLPSVGRNRDALLAMEDAASIYCELASHSPRWQAELVAALHVLSDLLARTGQADIALAVALEAEILSRKNAETAPAVWLPDLAESMNRLGVRWAEAGDEEAASVAGGESVALYRRLHEANPAVWRPNLAAALSNIAARHLAAGRPDQAVAAAREAWELQRLTTGRKSSAHQRIMVSAVANMAHGHLLLNQPEEAIQAIDMITEDTSAAEAEPADTDLADLLAMRSIGLSLMDDRGGAYALAREAADLARRCRESGSGRESLSRVLHNLGLRCRELGLVEEGDSLLGIVSS
ncbi:tetratricopeptide repeat protein [Actinoplanes utahensis]|uniref:Tetratricopeptide repeat protein n=1 Tax=Actinoplanes utahensis TaxID=1869 RepID=A0A0A6USZ4_ACTUT|nr:tetratricopeptide repeat protein [Actinoplanes utahensis]KHD77594.1 hypothetical protein MB27_10995 [Actinoplanes utahensis]